MIRPAVSIFTPFSAMKKQQGDFFTENWVK